MAKHPGLPKAQKVILSKTFLLDKMREIDVCHGARERIMLLENRLSTKIEGHILSMPQHTGRLREFNTSPYVVMIHTRKRGYSTIKELESDILSAKEFSSMETSAGRMIEEVLLPMYGWETVPSGMHTAYSAIDGKKSEPNLLHLATLKSGPRCLNDEMSENFADAIINNFSTWANDASVKSIDFTYGVLYGTKSQSNKKDWHILRNIKEKLPPECLIISPDNNWSCKFIKDGITVNVTVRVGSEWWEYLGGDTCLLELATAMVRSCVTISCNTHEVNHEYRISNLGEIVSMGTISKDYNVSLIQRPQIPWLFFFAQHFCDTLQN
ncbi:MAG: hypothetical protein LBJ82_05065 [Deltaproteobacteria bacterium]|jgi:hypothetical protein|nr:hypothetical protein [Deltaproteobacteria bacterium]